MQMSKPKLYLSFILTPLLLFTLHTLANALQLNVDSLTANPGQNISVNITVENYNQENIAAAAFTVAYSAEHLTLTGIDSNFFDTFQNQWTSLDPVPAPLPPTSVEVNGMIFNQPILFSTTGGLTMVAGARVEAGTPSTLFTLHFTINNTAPSGTYPVSISPTIINNVYAGYLPEGEAIPVLVGVIGGENDLSLAYPEYSPALVGGVITVQNNFVDTDHDGIDDNWERNYFNNNLDTANLISDYDGDGSTDIQEYLTMGSIPHTDPTVPDVLFTLVAGMNLISLPLSTDSPLHASDLLTAWSPDILSISQLNTTTQVVERLSYDDGTPQGIDFTLVPGKGYNFTMAQDTNRLLIGNVATGSIKLVAGNNRVGFVAPPPDYSAYQLLRDIGDSTVISTVQRFNRVTGLFETVNYQNNTPVGPDFPINRGGGYSITMHQDVAEFIISVAD